jgi:hypothetical protein
MIPWSPLRCVLFCDGVPTIGVATLGVGFPESCLVISRVFSLLDLEFCVGVATIGIAAFGVGFPESSQMISRGLSQLDLEF